MTEFESIIAGNYSQRELDNAVIRETDAFISDATDSLVSYVTSVGDARINQGWSWS
jgi:hypothetical protein